MTDEEMLATPSDWAQMHRQKALEWLGTPEGRQHLVEANRYDLCAKIIAAQAKKIEQLNAQLAFAMRDANGDQMAMDGSNLA